MSGLRWLCCQCTRQAAQDAHAASRRDSMVAATEGCLPLVRCGSVVDVATRLIDLTCRAVPRVLSRWAVLLWSQSESCERRGRLAMAVAWNLAGWGTLALCFRLNKYRDRD